MHTVKQRVAGSLVVFLFLVLVLPILFVGTAHAANLQQTWMRTDRMATSQPTTGTICAKPQTTSAVSVDVQVAFPSGFTVSGTGGNWAASVATIPNGSTAWPGIAAATPTVASQVVTWTYSGNQTLTAGTLYCFAWTNTAALTTPGSTGSSETGTITTRTTAGATIDTAQYATATVGANADQIGVTATVPATFTFGLGANSDTLGTLSGAGTVAVSSGVTATITTNAAAGWVAWVKSANAALNSASTGATIATTGTVNNAVDTLSGGTYGYLLDVAFTDSATAGTGTVTQAANYGQEYDGNSTTSGGTLSTSFQPVAAANGVTDGDTLTFKELARITAIQQAAADYSDTLTVIAAGRF